MLHEMKQLRQFRADVLRILPVGIEKNPHRAVCEDGLSVLHTAHPKGIPVAALADQIEGSDENQDDITEQVEIHCPGL